MRARAHLNFKQDSQSVQKGARGGLHGDGGVAVPTKCDIVNLKPECGDIATSVHISGLRSRDARGFQLMQRVRLVQSKCARVRVRGAVGIAALSEGRRRCRDAGFNPHVAYRINDCQMAQALVAAGEGIALLPRLMLRPAHQGVAIRPLATDPPNRHVSAVRLSTRYLTPATERFTALLVAAGADHADTRHGLR